MTEMCPRMVYAVKGDAAGLLRRGYALLHFSGVFATAFWGAETIYGQFVNCYGAGIGVATPSSCVILSNVDAPTSGRGDICLAIMEPFDVHSSLRFPCKSTYDLSSEDPCCDILVTTFPRLLFHSSPYFEVTRFFITWFVGNVCLRFISILSWVEILHSCS